MTMLHSPILLLDLLVQIYKLKGGERKERKEKKNGMACLSHNMAWSCHGHAHLAHPSKDLLP